MVSFIGTGCHNRLQVTAVLLVIFLSGCATHSARLLDTFPLLENHQSVNMDDVEVLSLSVPMQKFVERYVPVVANEQQKLQALTRAIRTPGILGFDYKHNLTLTAEQAFFKRQGNCLSFANLFVALARHAGLRASYQEGRAAPEWQEEDNVYILERHINVLVTTRAGNYVVDIKRPGSQHRNAVKVISDDYAKAQYFNNLGVYQLLENRIAPAHGYLLRALKTAPKSGYIWSNLGVIYRRNGQTEAAKWAYQRALEVDRKTYTAMNNLSKIYLQEGDYKQAQLLQQKAANHMRENPYYLLMLSDKAVAEKRYRDSLRLLRKALRKKDNEHRFHFAIARSLYLLGRQEQAEQSFSRAKVLAANPLPQVYNKQLSELVQ